MQQGGWPKLTGLCTVITAALMFWRPQRKSVVVRSLAWFMLMTTVVVGGLTVMYQLQPAPPDRPIERMYGNDRGELELGTCEVSVPKEHETGALESPSVLRLEFRQDTKRHVVLLGVHPESPSSFYADLHKCIEGSDRKEAFVFVHGYNVGFETAVRRTAQIAYDLKFQGAPIVYSWPSQEGLFSYTVDETNVVWTVPHLKEFLVAVAEQSGATAIHLIAHSMGNRALTSALRELVMDRNSKCPQFHEVILTAPDIDAEVFRRDIAPAIVQSADRVTLYASSNDEALVASRTVHGYRRAGESGDNVVIVPGVDTVDVSEIDTSLIGHSYYGSNSTVLADLFELMQGSKPPDQRQWLQSMRLGALKYWKFLREKFHPASPATSPPPPGEEL
jgi:esterase/lipase superfamily enzyme